MKLIMLQGLPASGKSTRAKEIVAQGSWIRLNRDLIREMLHFSKFSNRNEGIVVNVEKAVARACLHLGINVVIDDCNLNPKNKEMWSTIAKECGASFNVEKVKTDYRICLQRDDDREKSVGSNVIVNMAMQYDLLPRSLFQDRSFVISDLDGTICDITHRLHFVKDLPEGDKPDWKSFFASIPNDRPRQDVIDKIENITTSGRHPLVLVSARPETYRKETEEWLRKHFPIPYLTLIMRVTGDRRPDTEVKQEMYEKYFKGKYPIHTIFDDRPSIIRMWKGLGLGLNVVDVGKGEEF